MPDVIITPASAELKFVRDSPSANHIFNLASGAGILLDSAFSSSVGIWAPFIYGNGSVVNGSTTINGNLTVTGSIFASTFSSSNIYITSSQLIVADNILTLNALTPYKRYAGIEMYDSGSGTLSSLLWDGQSDYFFISGSGVNGKILTGPDGQTDLTANYVPKATGSYKLGNSLIFDNGTSVGINTATPEGAFNVAFAGGKSVFGSTSGGNNFVWSRSSGGSISLFAGGAVGVLSTSDIRFIVNQTYGSENFAVSAIITTAGNFGLGTTTPNAKLQVVGNADIGDSTADTGIIVRHGAGSSQYGRIRFYDSNNVNINTIHSFPTAWNAGTLLNSSAGAINLQGSNGVTFGSWNNIDVAFAQGGNNYFKGNVGIGTTTPASKLTVVTTVATSSVLSVQGTNGTLLNVLDDLSDSLLSVNNLAGLPVLEVFADNRVIMGQYNQNDFVLKNNKIGIGTNNPQYQLDISSSAATIRVGSALLGSWPNGGTYAFFGNQSLNQSTAGNYALLQYTDGSTFLNAAGGTPIYFRIGNSQKMILASDGRVGIGTTIPATYLDVRSDGNKSTAGPFNIAFFGSTDASNPLGLVVNHESSSGIRMVGLVGTEYGISGKNIKINEVMTVQYTGNVGIGSIDPQYKLDVNGAISAGSIRTTSQFTQVGGAVVSYITPAIYANGSSTSNAFGIVSNTTFANQGAIANIGLHQTTSNANDITAGVYMAIGGWFQNSGTGLPVYIGGGYTRNSSSILSVVPSDTLGNGNVGIRTSSPGDVLEVVGSGAAGIRVSRSGVSNQYATLSAGSTGPTLNASSNVGGLSLGINGVTYLTINSSGFVGIGTTSPTFLLDVSGSSRHGSTSSNTHQFTGSVSITGSLNATSSWANNAVSASFATTAQTANALNPSNTYTVAGLTSAYVDVTGAGTIPTTGIYRPSTKTLGLSADSTLIFKISNVSSPATSSIETGNFIVSSGNVGIGTTSPVSRFTAISSGSVFDNTNVMAAYFGRLTATGYGSTFIRVARSDSTTTTGSGDYTDVEHNSGGNGPFRYGTFSDSNIINGGTATNGVYGSINFVTSGSTRMTVAGGTLAGNVGIGTVQPGAKLQIVGSSNELLLDVDSSGFAGRYALLPGRFFVGTYSSGYPEIGYNYKATASTYTKLANDTSWRLTFGNSNSMRFSYSAVGTGTFTWTDLMVLSSSGLCVGTTAPTGKLQLGSDYADDGYGGYDIYVKSSTASTLSSYDPRVTNTSAMGLLITDNSATTTGPDKIGLVLYNNNATAGAFSPMLLFSKKETGSTPYKATMAGIYARAPLGTGNSDSWTDGELIFATAGAATEGIKQRMVIDKDGNVGIGTSAPNSKLHVNSSGSLTAGSVVLRVEGTSGSLFSVDDTLSGSLMSVNDITGLPILEVFSNNTVVMGTYNANTLVVTGSNVGIGTSVPTSKLEVKGSLIAGGVDNGSVIFYRNTNPATIGNTDAVLYVSDRSNSDWGITVDKDSSNYGLRINVTGSADYAFAISDGTTYQTRFSGAGDAYFARTITAGKAGNSSANFASMLVTSAGTTTSQAAIAIQQATSEGDTIIFCDYDPYVEYNFMHENNNNDFIIHGGGSTNNLGNNTFYNRAGNARTGYKKHIFNVDTGNMYVGGAVGVGTDTPSGKMTVKAGTSDGSTAFLIRNSGDTSVFTVYDNGSLNTAGSITAASGIVASTDRNLYGYQSTGLTVQATTNYSGWYRIARSTVATNGYGLRGGAKVYVGATGGYLAPGQDIISLFKDWSTASNIGTIESSCGSYFSAYRIVTDGNYAYLEGYIPPTLNIAGSATFSVMVQSFFFNTNNWVGYNENLTAGLTNFSSSFVLNKILNGLNTQNLHVSGSIGVGTTTPSYSIQIGQNTVGDNTNYRLGIFRNGTLGTPGTYQPGAIAVEDIAGDGPTSVDATGVVYVNAGRIATTDTYADNASLLNIRNDNGGILRVSGKANVYVGYVTPTTGSQSNSLLVNGNVGISTVNPGYKLEVIGDARVSGGIINGGLSAQWTLSGGGTTTYDGTSISWSARVIAIPVERTEFSDAGYIDIGCPTSGTITYYNSSNATTTVTCTATGIPIAAWESLYYEVTPGQGASSDQTKFRLVNYNNNTWRPSSNWLLICTRNGDSNSIRWIPGQVTIPNGGSFDVSNSTNNWQISGTTNYVAKFTAANKVGNSVIYDSGSNVGIGTTTLPATLTVKRSSGEVARFGTPNGSTGYILIGRDDGNTAEGLQLAYNSNNGDCTIAAVAGSHPVIFKRGATGGTETMRIDGVGNVGIGTSSPVSRLHIYNTGTAQVFNQLQLVNYGTGNNGDIVGIGFDAGETTQYGVKGSIGFVRTANYGRGDLTFYINNTAANETVSTSNEKMRITRDGFVGIGTTTPASKLTVVGTVATSSVLSAQGVNGTLFNVIDDLSDSLLSVNNLAGLPVLEVFADNRVIAGQYNQYDFVIKDNKVGIGTNLPLSKLYVTSSTSIPSAVFMGGSVGIGITSPSYTFHVVNTNQDIARFEGTTANQLVRIGNSSATSVSDLILISTGGQAEFFRGGSGYGSWGGANALNIYNSTGPIAFHPNGQTNKMVLGSDGGLTLTPNGSAPFQQLSGSQGLYVRVGYDTDGTAVPVLSSTNTMLQSSGNVSGTFTFVCGNTKILTLTTSGGTLVGTMSATSFSGAGTGLTGTASSLSIGGSAGSADSVTGTGGQLRRYDLRTIAPNNNTAGYLQFGFTSYNNNNTSPYADYLHMRSYTDASGGNDNLVMFRKDALGMRIWQQSWGSSTAYASYKDVCWTDGTNVPNGSSWNITSSWASNTINSVYATGDTLSVVTGRGASTSTQISVATSAGGSMFTGTKSGAGYSDGVSGATFKSITDNPNANSYAFAAYYSGSSGNNSFYVRADGLIYTTFNTATGIANNSFNVAKTILGTIHIANGAGATGNNRQAAITFQGGSSSEAQAGIYVSNNDSSGTAMGFATTDSYGTGPQLFMTATSGGTVDFPRARPKYNGNTIIDTAYTGTVSGLSIGGTAATASFFGGTVAIANGGTGATTAANALTNLGAAAVGQTMYLGTTAVAINRSSGALTLNGVSIDGSAGSAGTVTNGVYTTGAQNIGGVKSFTSTMNVTGVKETVTTVAAAAAVTINLNLGTIFKLTFSSTVSSFTVTNSDNTNITAGNSFTLISAPDNSNAKTITFVFSTNGSNVTVKWPNGATAPTATITSGKVDVFSFVYDGTNWYGFSGGLNY